MNSPAFNLFIGTEASVRENFSSLFKRLFKNHQVLPRQKIVGFFPNKAGGFEFLADLSLAHFMERLDRHLGILGAIFQKNDPPSRAQRLHQGLLHFGRMRKLVVGIDHQGYVDRLRRQADPISPRTRTGIQLTNLRLAALCPDSKKLARAITAGQGSKRSWTEWTPKLFASLEIIRDCLASGKQVLVGSPFRDFSSALCSKLSEAEVSCVLLDGGTPPAQRGLLANEFKRGIHSVLVAGLKAMGEGHSFENCSELILPGLSFAYDENEQFIHRVWRINSPVPVRIHLLVLEGSIDEKLHEIYTEKGDSSDLAIDGRLFREPISNPDPAWIIKEAARIFQKDVPSTDEQNLIDRWESSLARQLHHAHLKYLEHKPASGPDADERRAAIELTDLPSPTQHSVDILRKHYKAGTFSRVTSQTIASSIAKLKAINRQHRTS